MRTKIQLKLEKSIKPRSRNNPTKVFCMLCRKKLLLRRHFDKRTFQTATLLKLSNELRKNECCWQDLSFFSLGAKCWQFKVQLCFFNRMVSVLKCLVWRDVAVNSFELNFAVVSLHSIFLPLSTPCSEILGSFQFPKKNVNYDEEEEILKFFRIVFELTNDDIEL